MRPTLPLILYTPNQHLASSPTAVLISFHSCIGLHLLALIRPLVGILVSLHNPRRQCITSLDLFYFPIFAPLRFIFIHSSSTALSDPLQICHQGVGQSPALALDSALPAAVAEETHLQNLVVFRLAAYHLGEGRACHQAVGMEERRCSLASRRWGEEMGVEMACRGRQLKTPCIVSSKQSNDVRYEREITAYEVESLLGH